MIQRISGARRRALAVAVALVALLLVGWQLAAANATAVPNPVNAQVKQFLPSLRDSEAEYANGAYIPGVGAFYTIDLVRGPNSVKGKPSYQGTRDWAIYLMQAFGSKLDQVPRTESISFSVDFYDYSLRINRQLVVTCLAADAATPAKYAVFLDGKPYAEAAAQAGAAAQPAASGGAAPTATRPNAPATPAAKASAAASAPAANGAAATTGPANPSAAGKGPTPTAGPYTGTFSFADPQSAKEWTAVTGRWVVSDGYYAQTEEGKFDLMAISNRRLSGDYSFQADMKYVSGEMGGGLVFNVPTDTGKPGAQMVSYTAGGKFVHWGYFDANGVFQYQGGATVPDGADGKQHTLAIQVTGKTYAVTLDGVKLGTNLPLTTTTPGYVGLVASTSQVQFDNLKVESK